MKDWMIGFGMHGIWAALGLATAYAVQHPIVGVAPEWSALVGILAQQVAMHGAAAMQAYSGPTK